MTTYMQFLNSSCLAGHNMVFLEDMYERFHEDPNSVDQVWREFFEDVERYVPGKPENAGGQYTLADMLDMARQQVGVKQLIDAYRTRGLLVAQTDPLARQTMPEVPELELEFWGLKHSDLHHHFNSGSFVVADGATLEDLLAALNRTYCGAIGWEYMHIADGPQRLWLQQRIESCHGTATYEAEQRLRILKKLIAAEKLEEYLHKKFTAQKRFSLQGGESLIPLLDALIQHAGMAGTKELVIGMAHRGRLNVLVNTLGKRPHDLYAEFEGHAVRLEDATSGDVKYHLGFSSDEMTEGGPVHLTLAFNPSHLEQVNPVVEGSVRARQERCRDESRNLVIPVLIHGDSAMSGQGIVMETLNLSKTRGYKTGGTIHIVINNQIGFTTSDPRDTRSSLYCTDVAKLVSAPVMHVNGDDPEAVMLAVSVAFEYRMRFNTDVVIDLVCYRRLGHNEVDEPSVTQPLMYKAIGALATTSALYAQRLVADGVLEQSQVDEMTASYLAKLDAGESVADEVVTTFKEVHAANWKPFIGGSLQEGVDTSVEEAVLRELTATLTTVPAGFSLHPQVRKVVERRLAMGNGELPIDWGCAEHLAFATLLKEGYIVRLSGQDSGRGTFSHRHAVWHDQDRERREGGVHIPLKAVSDKAYVYDSVLSELSVLGFEYGYSTTNPNALVIWEAQFGDFANCAQAIIDQFIASGEAKWGRHSGLVLLLPHGMEGQGPEHSSARLERYLQLCAEDNMQVCVPTTPAQMFHLLRRQMLRNCRKPLIVMSPKSLLRHKDATSSLAELTGGSFMPVINDAQADMDKVTRIVLCSGKVFYDLDQVRRERNLTHVAIVRVEELYPLPENELREALRSYPFANELVWAQEEAQNQGAWSYLLPDLQLLAYQSMSLMYAGRKRSAAPATGFHHDHAEQQQALVLAALGIN